MKSLLCSMLCLLVSLAAHPAAHYLISPSWTSGDTKTLHGVTFTRGSDNVFTSYAALANHGIANGSTIHFDAGTYSENMTIGATNVTLLGYNAYLTTATGTRSSSESILTGTMTVAASGVTINGFAFTGAGRVYVTSGSPSSPQTGISFIYNNVYSSTIGYSVSQAVFMVGAYSGTSYLDTACSYKDITVSHNRFVGGASNLADFVHVSGSFGTTTIEDNTFNDGGHSVSLTHTQGTVNVRNNTFTNVGNPTRDTSSAGMFAIRLYYIATANSTTVNIRNNVFDGCNGQGSLYPCIRFFNGDTSSSVTTAVNCKINVNYNTFLNKTKVLSSTPAYNYVFYNNNNPEVPVDFSLNRFDCNEYAVGVVKRESRMATAGTFFASSSSVFRHAGDYGVGAPTYYTGPVSTSMQAQTIGTKSTRVCQSFDIDDETGDIYFVQISASTSTSETLVVTRWYKNAETGNLSKQYMTLTNAGHGTNLAVCSINSQRWIFTGGNSTYNSSSGSEQSKCCTMFRFVSGATADLSKTSFTKTNTSGTTTTYAIKQFDSGSSYSWRYPAVDRDNGLFAERSMGDNQTEVRIYNLYDVFDNPTTAKPLKVISIANGANKFTTSSGGNTAQVANADNGFKTWTIQGFTISGDYIYFLEGAASTSSGVKNTSGTSMPVVMIHAYNWRQDKFSYRSPTLRAKIITNNISFGEPEGIKLHRDANGRTHMILAIGSGSEGARTVSLLDYAPPQQTNATTATVNNETCRDESMITPVITTGASSLSFAANYGSSASQNLAVAYQYPAGEPIYHIVGPDAQCFSVSGNPSAFSTSETLTITYKPTDLRTSHLAYLVISAPGATDKYVTLSAGQSLSTLPTSTPAVDMALTQPTENGKYSFNLSMTIAMPTALQSRSTDSAAGSTVASQLAYYVLAIPAATYNQLAKATSVTLNGTTIANPFTAITRRMDMGNGMYISSATHAYYYRIPISYATGTTKSVTLVWHNVAPNVTASGSALKTAALASTSGSAYGITAYAIPADEYMTDWAYANLSDRAGAVNVVAPAPTLTVSSVALTKTDDIYANTADNSWQPDGALVKVYSGGSATGATKAVHPVAFKGLNTLLATCTVGALPVTDEVLQNNTINYQMAVVKNGTSLSYGASGLFKPTTDEVKTLLSSGGTVTMTVPYSSLNDIKGGAYNGYLYTTYTASRYADGSLVNDATGSSVGEFTNEITTPTASIIGTPAYARYEDRYWDGENTTTLGYYAHVAAAFSVGNLPDANCYLGFNAQQSACYENNTGCYPTNTAAADGYPMWQHSFAGSSSANGGSPLNFDFGSVGKIAGYTEYEAQDGQAWTANYTDANNWSALAVNDGRIAIHINPAFRYASKADYEAGKDLSGSIPVTLKVYMPMDPTTYYTIGGKRGANAPRRAITSSLTLSPEIEVEGNVTQSIVLSDAAIVTGIDEVAADAADQAPVYYNLQGIRVENPQAGQVYIEVRGRRATKTFIR